MEATELSAAALWRLPHCKRKDLFRRDDVFHQMIILFYFIFSKGASLFMKWICFNFCLFYFLCYCKNHLLFIHSLNFF